MTFTLTTKLFLYLLQLVLLLRAEPYCTFDAFDVNPCSCDFIQPSYQ